MHVDVARLRECLDADATRLRDVVASADLTAVVPTCPDWTVADLAQHVGAVYLHKVECIRTLSNPDPWPPAGMADEEPRSLLARGREALTAELARRSADSPAFTWYVPDQSVGFWIRRMAHESAIHRVDAELAAGVDRAPLPADLAVDGVDEFLSVFVGYGSQVWPQDFETVLADVDGRAVRLITQGASWTVRPTKELVEVVPDGTDDVALTITAEPADLLLWVWERADDSVVTLDGDHSALAGLRQVFRAGSQ
jgi:uncharacterized protein (TIGR03083 family)